MEKLEEYLYEKYGTRVIPAEDIGDILKRAVRDRILTEDQVEALPAMPSSQLLEHIGRIRRKFIFSDSTDLDTEKNPGSKMMGNPDDPKALKDWAEEQGTVPLDGVMKAYLEYERLTKKGKERVHRWNVLALFTVFLLGGGLYFSYTPVPY